MKRREKLLLKRLRQGDRTACVELIDATYRDVYGYLLALAGTQEQAEDLTQAAFTKAWTSVAGFEGRSSFRTWLLAIARNEFLLQLRAQDRQPETAELTNLEIVQDTGDTPDVRAFRELQAAEIRTAVRDLPTLYREVISLHYFTELTITEAARVLHIPAGTVKSRISKALALLKHELGKEVIGDEGSSTDACTA